MSKVSPRPWGQPSPSWGAQPSGSTTHIADPELEGSTRTVCGGVPTCSANDDHRPSSEFSLGTCQRTRRGRTESRGLPYQFWLGGMLKAMTDEESSHAEA